MIADGETGEMRFRGHVVRLFWEQRPKILPNINLLVQVCTCSVYTKIVGTRGTCVHVKSRCKNYIIHTDVLFLLFVKQFEKTLTFYTTLFIDLVIKKRPLCNPHVGFGTTVCRFVVYGTGCCDVNM